MNAPPGAEALHGPRWNHSQRETTTGDARLVEVYLHQAYATGVAADMQISHRKLVRLVRAFVATRAAGEEFLGWLISYKDPTGETAVWNVLKGRTS